MYSYEDSYKLEKMRKLIKVRLKSFVQASKVYVFHSLKKKVKYVRLIEINA